jgi:diaminopimelate epimerase
LKIQFSKYHGTGNDFIMVDDRTLIFPAENREFIRRLCHRRFGIGADGVILIRNHGTLDFRMVYFNSDGREGSMCGNGGRCAAAFAFHLGMSGEQTVFETIDGIHEAVLLDQQLVRLRMNNVSGDRQVEDHFLLNTGSPHYVKFVEGLEDLDVVQMGRLVRFSRDHEKEGINVNFAQANDNELYVRTYERGVEDETWSCGTGAVAAAISMSVRERSGKKSINIATRGGKLKVTFRHAGPGNFEDVFLEGPAIYVYKGTVQPELLIP